MTDPKNSLLVEGNTDLHVLYNLFKAARLPDGFCKIEDCKNDETALSTFIVAFRGSPSQAVGLILDADQDPAKRWKQIKDRARKKGGDDPLPESPDPTGTVVKRPGKPTLGVWLMPDNTTLGMLEDFLLALVPSEHDPLMGHARATVAALSGDMRRFRPQHASKAEVHTYLAWQKEPGTPPGLGISKGYFDPSQGPVPDFLAWIERLFGPFPPSA
ncbi:DUF3226 domain-containing protein [Pararhodospirillum oryzae]|uniref:DUF4435 domain-containing protein n=1 Tax=Pararhodospirillum oryzae TaxID=478448 RepID=A0A512H6V1_9PROT|nr:DUF3226 domain-containing protein [Pararhodospirillum oryzae]GEO81186.1 hypothetical protein ROR02_13170 [Pararhodospirillum oryzae]